MISKFYPKGGIAIDNVHFKSENNREVKRGFTSSSNPLSCLLVTDTTEREHASRLRNKAESPGENPGQPF